MQNGIRLVRLPTLALLVMLSFVWAGYGVNGSNAEDADRFFEKTIRPLFIEHCIQCHGEDKSEGGLRLDRRDGFLSGGESGSLLDRDRLDASRLLQAVRHESLEMPPNKKLADDLIESLEKWVRDGAVWPEYVVSIAPKNAERTFTDEDRKYWFFQPVQDVEVPASPFQHPIDAYIQDRLTQIGLSIGENAPQATLVRRLYLDLLGVPPTWDELQRYLGDSSSDKYERLVETLLDDERYGERWGRYWLDLVRYAESDGFKQDAFRPSAYQYRDYVIRSLNQDKPYGQFVAEQIAGDELAPESDEMNAATGYLRHWIYEYNQRDVRSQWDNILNDLTDVTGEVFLGIGYSCARCHDHKFDPILQKDYYRLQAFFAPIEPRYDIPISQEQERIWSLEHAQWSERAKPIRDRMAELEKEARDATVEATIEKFPPDVRPALRKNEKERLPEERGIAVLASLQIQNDLNAIEFSKRLKGEAADEWSRLKAELDALKKTEPQRPERALTVRDIGKAAPQTKIPGKRNADPVSPGIPTILDPMEMEIDSPSGESTGRRTALARWITDSKNPFTWRTIVNRMWQHHFGRGIVSNASDFGRLSEAPTHPELLDWLSTWFIQNGGSLKKLHFLMVTSQTYRQSSYPRQSGEGLARDALNKFLWRYTPHRMDADQVRDSILACTAEIDFKRFGPSAGHEAKRRSIYLKQLRNTQEPLLAVFDAPDGSSSVAKRNQTTTALQALFLANNGWSMKRAEELAERIRRKRLRIQEAVVEVYHSVLLREPSEAELALANTFFAESTGGEASSNAAPESDESMISKEKLTDFCHALLNANEFLYVE